MGKVEQPQTKKRKTTGVVVHQKTKTLKHSRTYYSKSAFASFSSTLTIVEPQVVICSIFGKKFLIEAIVWKNNPSMIKNLICYSDMFLKIS